MGANPSFDFEKLPKRHSDISDAATAAYSTMVDAVMRADASLAQTFASYRKPANQMYQDYDALASRISDQHFTEQFDTYDQNGQPETVAAPENTGATVTNIAEHPEFTQADDAAGVIELHEDPEDAVKRADEAREYLNNIYGDSQNAA